MLKIIAGEFRSRILASPEDARVSRPYAGRVKESIFNVLRGWFDGARVLDLFAGVGTMGLEAISRGASAVLMVERDRDIYALLQQNVETLGCGDRAITVLGDALSPGVLDRAPRPVDVIFVDPPYDLIQGPKSRARVLEQITRCREIMGEKGFVVLRSPLSPRDADFSIDGFEGPEVHDYGADKHVLLYAPKAKAAA